MRPLNPTLTFGDAKPPSQRENARRALIVRRLRKIKEQVATTGVRQKAP